MQIKSVYDKEFGIYGQILEGYDYTELFEEAKKMPLPENGIVYIPSVSEFESCKVFEKIQKSGFGGLPVELGYCAGKNDVLNCLEFHKSSEFNITQNEIILALGKISDIKDGTYNTENVELFLVPAGMGVELYATTLHYAPWETKRGIGFRMICALPKGTNEKEESENSTVSIESKMLCAVNKWLLCHPESPEAQNGGYIGLVGENLREDYL